LTWYSTCCTCFLHVLNCINFGQASGSCLRRQLYKFWVVDLKNLQSYMVPGTTSSWHRLLELENGSIFNIDLGRELEWKKHLRVLWTLSRLMANHNHLVVVTYSNTCTYIYIHTYIHHVMCTVPHTQTHSTFDIRHSTFDTKEQSLKNSVQNTTPPPYSLHALVHVLKKV